MTSEQEYTIEFEHRPGKWIPISGAIYRDKEEAEERSKREAEEMGTKTRVVPVKPVWDEWNFTRLASRMKGSTRATLEMKRRGEAGAIAAWSIYKGHIKHLIRVSCQGGRYGPIVAREPAFRATMSRELEAVGENSLIEQIDGLWRKYPKGIPESEIIALEDDWDESIERKVGRRIPENPSDLSREDIEESRRLTKEMYEAKEKESSEEKLSDLEEMKRELERKIERLRREGK